MGGGPEPANLFSRLGLYGRGRVAGGGGGANVNTSAHLHLKSWPRGVLQVDCKVTASLLHFLAPSLSIH